MLPLNLLLLWLVLSLTNGNKEKSKGSVEIIAEPKTWLTLQIRLAGDMQPNTQVTLPINGWINLNTTTLYD
jgi:hypothetical protein